MGGTAGLMLGISLSTFVGLIDLLFQEWIPEILPNKRDKREQKLRKNLKSICFMFWGDQYAKLICWKFYQKDQRRMPNTVCENKMKLVVRFFIIIAREYRPISIVLIPYFRKLFMNYTEKRDLPGKELFDNNLLHHCSRNDMNHKCES